MTATSIHFNVRPWAAREALLLPVSPIELSEGKRRGSVMSGIAQTVQYMCRPDAGECAWVCLCLGKQEEDVMKYPLALT